MSTECVSNSRVDRYIFATAVNNTPPSNNLCPDPRGINHKNPNQPTFCSCFDPSSDIMCPSAECFYGPSAACNQAAYRQSDVAMCFCQEASQRPSISPARRLPHG